MNLIYALRYSRSLRALVAVSEICARHVVGGATAGAARRVPRPSVLAAALTAAWAVSAQALPTGAAVAAGQVSVQQVSSTTLNVVQGTQQGIVNWQSFGIQPGETVNFIQPGASSVTLNRVVGADPSASVSRS